MEGDYAPWIALASGVVGMVIGYFMGYRTGCIAGELTALKSKRIRREHSRAGTKQSLGKEADLEDSDRMEFSS